VAGRPPNGRPGRPPIRGSGGRPLRASISCLPTGPVERRPGTGGRGGGPGGSRRTAGAWHGDGIRAGAAQPVQGPGPHRERTATASRQGPRTGGPARTRCRRDPGRTHGTRGTGIGPRALNTDPSSRIRHGPQSGLPGPARARWERSSPPAGPRKSSAGPKRRQPPGGCGPGAAVVSVELKRRRGCIVPAPATESAEIDERTRENGSQHRRGRDLTGAHESPCPGSRPSGEAMGRESRARHHPVRLPGLRWPPPERRSPRIGQGCAPTARRRIAAAGLNVLKEPERRARQTRRRAEPVRSRARSQPLRTVDTPGNPGATSGKVSDEPQKRSTPPPNC
jgi:hypothetical protein